MADCVKLAGEGKQAFHVVVPSLPGFAFSSAPKQKGFGLKQIAKTLNQLMLELGYSKYVAQGLQSFLTTKLLLVQVFLTFCWSPCTNAAAGLHASMQLLVVNGMLHCADMLLRCADLRNFIPMSDVWQCHLGSTASAGNTYA